MFNVWFGALFILAHFALFLIGYRLFGKLGLYAWIGMATVLANLQVVKTIEISIFGFAVIMTLGNTMYGTIYLATDLLNEKYGFKAAKKAVWFGFFTLITTTAIMQLALVLKPQSDALQVQQSMETLFGLMPQIALGSLAAYFVSQMLDVKLFAAIKSLFPAPNMLWLRNLGSTLISQFVDTLIFCTIAFATEFEFNVWLSILITTYLIKFVVSIVSTPFIYVARGFKFKEDQ